MAITTLDKNELAKQYHKAYRDRLRRKGKTWEELPPERRQKVFDDVDNFLTAIGEMHLSIVPPEEVKTQKSIKLQPVREVVRPIEQMPARRRTRHNLGG